MAPGKSKAESTPHEVRISNKLNRKLTSYATTATAATLGLAAFAQPAEAKIVFTPISRVIGPNGTYRLDVNHDGIADFIIRNNYGCNTDYCFDGLSALPQGTNGVEGAHGFLSIPYAFALKNGATIGSGHPFSGNLMLSSNMGVIGRWDNLSGRYLGLKFQINGTTHYGWARFDVGLFSGPRIVAHLTGFAYETTANTPIVAGQTSDGESSESSLASPIFDDSPQPANLGLLARGSETLSVWRRN